MIGVDTNVLARLFVVDNAAQHRLAVEFFGQRSSTDPAYVSEVVQAELAWLLVRTMKYPVERLRAVLKGILESDDFFVEGREVLESAVNDPNLSSADLADFLIAGKAGDAGCQVVVTFDKPAAKHVPGMVLLK